MTAVAGATAAEGRILIRFSLACDHDHEFEAWFRSNDDFDTQKKRGFVECPDCGSHKVEQGADGAGRLDRAQEGKDRARHGRRAEARPWRELKALSEKMRENADYVGDKFAEEARKIHFGETEARGIYGEATPDEAKEPRRGRRRVHADPGFPGRPQLSAPILR